MDYQKQRKQIIETGESYTKAFEALGDARSVDLALEPLSDALSLEPECFPLIKGFEPLRLAKTKQAVRDLEIIPPLRLWFYIDDKTSDVHLHAIEIDNDYEQETENETTATITKIYQDS